MKILKVFIVTLAFLVLITAAILGLLYHHRNVEKKILTDADRTKTTGSYIRLKQGITHYQLAGPDTGKLVVLVNGFSVPYYIWDGTYDFLVKKGYRVLRYDAYGRGFSDRPEVPYNKDLYINQIYNLVNTLHLHTPFNIAGVSFGGEVITDFTCAYPNLVHKIILIDPGFEPNHSKPRSIAIFDEAIHANERVLGQLVDFKYPDRHPHWLDKYRQQMQYIGFRNALVSTMYDYKNTEWQSLKCLNSLQKPVLLIWGEDDQTVPFKNNEGIRKVLTTKFFPIADAAHLPQLEKPNIVNPKIDEFLRN
jgi:pimeloyl-ACP methyl ester carboxylesterase